MKALITGGTGFIGRALAARLLGEGWQARVATRRIPLNPPQGVEIAETDYGSVESLAKAVDGCDAVFHLAAAIFACSYAEFEKANAAATANLVAACAKAQKPPECFVYVSSLAAAGPGASATVARTEADPPAPASDYGKTKLAGEAALAALPSAARRVILRPAIVYGKNDSGVSKIARWVRRGLMINMCAGETMFSFTYIDDLVDAITEAQKNPALSGKAYFICEDRTYPWTHFISAMAKAMGARQPFMLTLSPSAMRVAGKIYQTVSPLIGADPVFNTDKAREACAGHWTASPRRWMEDAGRKSWTPLEEGLKKTFV
ncbi:MAG: NAD-dependent epimerase/dehydratase family protein [Elusimicrobiales bacterium]